ncbi:MAG: peptide-methionine (S)-S-oxide reductase MsrA [Nitrospirota bacterium]
MEMVTLGGGCFWCLEAIFSALKGVGNVVSGYTGGHLLSPTYHQICTGKTGHAEVVQIQFEPTVISLKEILTVFFMSHDPTTLNRQGADVGTQYRSAVFYHSENQKQVTQIVMGEMEVVWSAPIVTQVAPLDLFYPAEDYHQHYYERNPSQGYCQAVIAPKMVKLRKQFYKMLKTDGHL